MSDSSLISNTMLEVLTNVVIWEKVKRHADLKGRHKLIFTDNVIVYIRNPKNLLISEFSKVAGYKVNIWKSIVFSDTGNE